MSRSHGPPAPPLPADIQERVAEALAAMHRHPERWLLPWYRYAIYAALIEADALGGLALRARLDLAAARKALFCWGAYGRAIWPRDWLQPARLLALCQALVGGELPVAEAAGRIDHAHALADVAGEPATSPHYCAWCVFEAALRAADSALAYRQRCGAPGGEISIGADDAGTYAAIAVGGGEWQRVAGAAGQWSWQTEEVRLRRAVFWEWWLREGLPEAWRRSAARPADASR